MRKIFCFILAIIPLVTLAQKNNLSNISIEISDPYKVVDGSRKIYFNKNDNLLSVKILGETVAIQKYNTTTLKLDYTKKEDLPNGAVVESILELGNKYYLFYSLWDKSNKNEQLFYREIDFAEGKLKQAIRIITVNHHLWRISLGEIIGFWGHDVTSKFHFKLSDDKSKLLILYRHLRENRIDARNFDVVGINVFNQNIELLWKQEVKMPYSEKKMDFLDNAIDSNGNTYLIISLFKDNTTKVLNKYGDLNQRALIMKYENMNGQLIDTIPISLKNHFINKFGFYKVSDDKILLRGFYGDDKYTAQSTGIFFLEINQKNKLSSESLYEFPDRFFDNNNTIRDYEVDISNDYERRPELSDFKIIEQFKDEDNNTLILSEQQYISIITTYSKTGKHEHYHYHYNDIIISKIDSTGNLHWMKKLPKEQIGYKGIGAMSFKHLQTKSFYYIIFFDDFDNKDILNEERLVTYKDTKNSILCAYKVSKEDGSTEKITILDTYDIDGLTLNQFYINRLIPIDNNSFTLEAYKKKKEDVLIKVHFIK